jgi:GNAT superfamily N-acetyltransferase
MEIKQASAYQLVDALFLLKQCVIEMNKKGLKQWNSANPSPQLIKEDIEKGTLYLYYEMNIAQGMINLSEDLPEEFQKIDWKGKADKVLYIKRFAVHPLWVDSGVATNLMDFAEKYAKDNHFTSVRIDMLDSYPVDDKFFTSRNFVSAGSLHPETQKLAITCYEKNL